MDCPWFYSSWRLVVLSTSLNPEAREKSVMMTPGAPRDWQTRKRTLGPTELT